MLEFLLCSLVTILPDYLVRHYVQGKRWGREINLFSMWYELRWGLTACAILTITLITVIFYYHPSTSNVTSYFRTVTILPEKGGRVSEVFVVNSQDVAADERLFALDASREEAAALTARSRIAEIDAAQVVAASDLAAATGVVGEAEASLQQAVQERDRKLELVARAPDAVSGQEVDRLESLVKAREGALEAASASRRAVEARINDLLPAQRASAQAALAEATTELEKSVVYAGVAGRVHQFTLRPGDYVSAVLRPAGILVPADAGRGRFQAGFGQITAQEIRVGMVAEMACIARPFTIIPMVVTDVQDVIAAGQIRPSDQLLDPGTPAPPGSLTVYMEPLYAGQADTIPPGSRCLANAYSNFHEELAAGGLGLGTWLFYHMVDTVAVVHAVILRIQALMLPVQTLVLSGH